VALLLTFAAQQATAQSEEQRLGKRVLATTSLAVKEYALGVSGGRIVATEEVEEARLFLQEARSALEELPSALGLPPLRLVDSMLNEVERIGEPSVLSSLADSVSRLLNSSIPGLDERIPHFRPDADLGRDLYATACATCHGASGAGDGPAGASLDPPPSDLTNAVVLADQTPLDYFRKVMIGVSGTAMPAFEGTLTEDQIWEVAWFSTQLRYAPVSSDDPAVLLGELCSDCSDAEGDALPAGARVPAELADPENVARASDEQLFGYLLDTQRDAGRVDSARARTLIGYVRTLPFAVDRADIPALASTRAELLRGLRLASVGDHAAASAKVLDAYVAFEEVEPHIAVRDNRLTSEIEFAYAQLRSRVGSGAAPAVVASSYDSLDELLDRAEATLTAETSPVGFFVQSFFLLLREGVEALLIVGALAALVVRAGSPRSKRAIWWGVGAALVASLATAILIETIFRIGVAQQEVLEGVTMLVAAGVLLFVSYWLVSKVEVTRWKNFLADQGSRAIRQGSLLALAGAAFLAVYREGFETVLFYKALVITAGGSGVGSIMGGGATAAVALAGIYVGISKFGLRIPIRQFFGVTSAVLMYMAFSFAGKGIAELQESNLISTTIVDWAPRVPWMGIYPTTQSLVLQIGILGLIVAGLIWTFGVAPRLVPRSRTP
jgi:high-affinity iron transporter